MISKSIQCLVFLCMVLVWDFTAVRVREWSAKEKWVTTSVCKALPIGMRNRQQVQAQIDLAALPASISPNVVRWPDDDGLSNSILCIPRAHWGGADLIYRLMSLQR